MKGLFILLLSILWLALTFAEFLEGVVPIKKYPESCTAAKPKKNGIYKIQPKGQPVMSVFCDVALTGSPWLVIQRRDDVQVNFYRNWTTYQQGFGALDGSFFIGLDKLHAFTVSRAHELYIHLEDFDRQTRYARYSDFHIGNSANMYGLNVLGSYLGNAGDGLRSHQNMKWTTFDRDNDLNNRTNAAVQYTGAWWYNNNTHTSNLNGLYLGGDYGIDQAGRGITWNTWKGDYYSLKRVHMMIRPK